MVEKRSALILWACGFVVNTVKTLTAKDARETAKIAKNCPTAESRPTFDEYTKVHGPSLKPQVKDCIPVTIWLCGWAS
jgi:hypothetical protein